LDNQLKGDKVLMMTSTQVIGGEQIDLIRFQLLLGLFLEVGKFA
jgi:hypothetical protein